MREWRRREREYRSEIGEGLPECSEGILLFVLGGIGVFKEYEILSNNRKTIGILLIQTK